MTHKHFLKTMGTILSLSTCFVGNSVSGQVLSDLYAGVAVANTAITTVSNSNGSGPSQDGSKLGAKILAGYQFSRNWGVEVDYSRAQDLKQTYSSNGTKFTLVGNASIFSIAATGRYAINESFSVGGKLGFAQSDFSNKAKLTSGDIISGSSTGLIAGISAEYRVAAKVSLIANYDYLPKANSRLYRNQALGLKFSF